MSDLDPIYLDHHATTPADPRVVEAMAPWWTDDFGNAASHSHRFGWRAEAAVEVARESLVEAIGGRDPRELVFASGATESVNLAIKGVLEGEARRGDHVVTVATEHPAVLDTVRAVAARGARVTELPVGSDGLVDPDAVARALTDRTVLVSVMAANNEIGVLQSLEPIGRICGEADVLFHTDATQAVGKVPFDVETCGADLVSFSAHKLYGPKGVGALWARRRRRGGGRVRVAPQIHGGGHERGLRSGTLPVPLIVGFARAVDLCLAEREAEAERLSALRDQLLERLRDAVADVQLNGHPTQRLPANLNVAFPGVEADALITSLPQLAFSTGSACSSARAEPSHVLRALGLADARVRGSVRFGLGRGTTARDVAVAAEAIAAQVQKTRSQRAG